MGMAASQARFLGLTARKSNVEYQGQQINQQRTALANESANLYNQMLNLDVPTPPVTTDYYKTSYTIDGSAPNYSSSDYKITKISKTYNNENEYSIDLSIEKEYSLPKTLTYTAGKATKEENQPYKAVTFDADGKRTETDATGVKYSIPLTANGKTRYLTYFPDCTNPLTGENKTLSINTNQIYEYVPGKDIDGFDTCYPEPDANKKYYFFKDADGNNHFMDEDDLTKLIDLNRASGDFGFEGIYTSTRTETTTVIGYLEKASESDRYSSITIKANSDENDIDYPKNLAGKTFPLSTTREYDENAYNDAYNDYEYNKTMYEKAISDINTKTEIIQKEDQQLELRLDQLDTEQNAIAKEMDSVSKVIEDNVEKTFDAFA